LQSVSEEQQSMVKMAANMVAKQNLEVACVFLHKKAHDATLSKATLSKVFLFCPLARAVPTVSSPECYSKTSFFSQPRDRAIEL
jgi:hypothetical protein